MIINALIQLPISLPALAKAIGVLKGVVEFFKPNKTSSKP